VLYCVCVLCGHIDWRKHCASCLLEIIFFILRVVCSYSGNDCDNDNRKWYKYVCITTNQPDTKSNPNPNLTAKQHTVVSTRLNVVTCLNVLREIHTRQYCFTVLQLTVVIVTGVAVSLCGGCRILTGLKITGVASAVVAMQRLLDCGVRTVVLSSTELGTTDTLIAFASTVTGTAALCSVN